MRNRLGDHPLLTALPQRVLVGNGATGTMLPAADRAQGQLAGVAGCHQFRGVIRPKIVPNADRARAAHRAVPRARLETLVVHHQEAQYLAAR